MDRCPWMNGWRRKQWMDKKRGMYWSVLLRGGLEEVHLGGMNGLVGAQLYSIWRAPWSQAGDWLCRNAKEGLPCQALIILSYLAWLPSGIPNYAMELPGLAFTALLKLHLQGRALFSFLNPEWTLLKRPLPTTFENSISLAYIALNFFLVFTSNKFSKLMILIRR